MIKITSGYRTQSTIIHNIEILLGEYFRELAQIDFSFPPNLTFFQLILVEILCKNFHNVKCKIIKIHKISAPFNSPMDIHTPCLLALTMRTSLEILSIL